MLPTASAVDPRDSALTLMPSSTSRRMWWEVAFDACTEVPPFPLYFYCSQTSTCCGHCAVVRRERSAGRAYDQCVCTAEWPSESGQYRDSHRSHQYQAGMG